MTAAQATHDAAVTAIGLLTARRLSIATAESLTGGLVVAALTSVPGASAVVRGGVVAYAADMKASLLGVPAELLGRVGTVHPQVALAMARGVAARMGADAAIATTGVAGPDPVDGHAVGTVHIAVIMPGSGVGVRQSALALAGDREQIRRETVSRGLNLLIEALLEDNA